MTASSGVVLSNLAYLLGAILLAVIGGVIVWLHHRQPKSVDANVESFHRGLRALAPDASIRDRFVRSGRPDSRPVRIQPRSTRSPETAAETGDRPAIRLTTRRRPPTTQGGVAGRRTRLIRNRTRLRRTRPPRRRAGPRAKPPPVVVDPRRGNHPTRPPETAPATERGPRLARDLAIDLGTANTLVYSRGRGIVLNEPTVIALNSRTQDVLAMGQEAWQMIGRTPGYIVAVRPAAQGRHHRLRHHPADDPAAAAAGRRLPVQPAPGPDLRALGHHRSGAPGGRGGGPGRRRQRRLPDRAAHGRGHRRRPADPRAARQHGRRRRRWDHRDGGHLPRRHRGPPGHPGRQLRHRRLHPDLRAARVRDRHRGAHGRGDQAGHRLGVADRRRDQGRGSRAAT